MSKFIATPLPASGPGFPTRPVRFFLNCFRKIATKRASSADRHIMGFRRKSEHRRAGSSIGLRGGSAFFRRVRGERGQALVLAALCVAILVGMLGFATDVGLLFIAKRNLQIAADSAARAGAAELNYGDYASAAQTASALNGFTNGVNGVTVTVNPSGTSIPSPLYGPYKGQAGYLEVAITQIKPTYFMKVFHWNSMPVSARAVGTLGNNPNCIYLLATSGTDLTMSNGASISAPACGLLADSSSTSALSVTDGTSVAVSKVGIVGSEATQNGTVTPTPVTGIAPFSDPLAYLTPPPYTGGSSCTADPGGSYQGGSTYSVGPGSAHSTTQSGNTVCYTSLTLGGNGNKVTLNPGIYVVTGYLTFSSGTILGGAGVMFYLPGTASLTIANGAIFNMTAPTSGTYNGILFYQDRADTQAASIQGGGTSSLKGIFYFPAAALTLGNGSATTFYTPIVASTLTMYGGSAFTDDDYSTVNLSSPLTSPRLVD